MITDHDVIELALFGKLLKNINLYSKLVVRNTHEEYGIAKGSCLDWGEKNVDRMISGYQDKY